MRKLLFIVVGFAVLIAGGVYYLLQPKSLGISYTTANLESIYKKLNVTYEPLPANVPANKSLIVSGSHPIDQIFSSEELTAIADNRVREYAYFPFRNVQIRVNADGTVEGSGTINYSDGVRYLTAMGVSSEDIAGASAKFKIPNANLPVYLKVSGTIANNNSRISVEQAQIANIPVPQNLRTEYTPAFNGFIESIIKTRQPSINVDKLEVLNGKVHYAGSAPDKEMAVKNLN